MTKKGKYQGKRHQKRNPDKNNQSQTTNNILVTLQQYRFWLTELSRKIQGVTYAFDSYLKFSNKEKEFNDFILERLKQAKAQEKKSEKPDGSSSKGVKQ